MSEPLELYGASAVARMLGVTRAAVSNWLTRHADTPAPFAVVRDVGDYATLLWNDDGMHRWREWYGVDAVTVTIRRRTQ